jgi:hypothetical protein
MPKGDVNIGKKQTDEVLHGMSELNNLKNMVTCSRAIPGQKVPHVIP